jgi:hypothetical protein
MTKEVSEKTREDRVCRELVKHGLALIKIPSRFWLRDFYAPGYMILEGNIVVSGVYQRQYEDTLEHVEWYAFVHLANKANKEAA